MYLFILLKISTDSETF